MMIVSVSQPTSDGRSKRAISLILATNCAACCPAFQVDIWYASSWSINLVIISTSTFLALIPSLERLGSGCFGGVQA